MHDIITIARLNQQAFAEHVARQQAEGKHAVAVYEGMHLSDAEFFGTEAEAIARCDVLQSARRFPGTSYVYFAPARNFGN